MCRDSVEIGLYYRISQQLHVLNQSLPVLLNLPDCHFIWVMCGLSCCCLPVLLLAVALLTDDTCATVDWASLAKQWIAQREVMGMTSSDTQYVCQPPQQHVPAAPPPPPPPPHPSDDGIPGNMPVADHHMPVGDISMAHTHGMSSVKCVCLCITLTVCVMSKDVIQ